MPSKFCTSAQNLDAIITRNPKDFRLARISVLSTHQVLEQLDAEF
ncbi:hypothetical protein [Acaryochloris sp. 'Moss Beach']|nr:hypothetical protein [Acaryochloris sp. 'Moss Beach']